MEKLKLESERLILRDWLDSDVEDLIESLSDIRVTQWLAYVANPYSLEDALTWIKYCQGNAAMVERISYEFAIELKSEGKVIGGVSINRINKSQGTAGGGIWTNYNYHGFGYGREAFARRIDFAFAELGLRRLESGFIVGNTSSQLMQISLGYQIEGLKREAYICLADGKVKNEYITALLRAEWEKRRK